MSTNNSNVRAGVVDCGAHPTKEQSMVFNIRGFENIGTDADGRVLTPRIFCHGFHWQLKLYPNGHDEEERGNVSLFLCCCEVESGIIESVRARHNAQVPNRPSSIRMVGPKTYSKDNVAWGNAKFWTRDEAISFCDTRGTLTIEVSLQVYPDEKEVSCWKPGKTNGTKVASLYDSKIRADAAFVIGDRRFEVHRWILDLNAPTLAGMFGDDDNVNQVDVPIKGADPNLFEVMIRFLYTEDLQPGFNDEEHALDLLKLADKFGCSNLKMLLEARIVETPQILCLQNAADLLVLADAKNCALLLERSLKLIVENIPGIYETEGWKYVEASAKLMKTIINAQSNHRNVDAEESVSVSVLRKRAFEHGLGADGSREDLIKRLKAHDDTEEAESAANDDESTDE